MEILSRDCRRDVRTDSWQLILAIQHANRFTGCEKKPAATEAHHSVPDQADHRNRQLYTCKTFPLGEPVQGCHLVKLARYGPQRLIERESHVPGLPRENRKNGGRLQAEEAPPK